jgi:hypothetical protein
MILKASYLGLIVCEHKKAAVAVTAIIIVCMDKGSSPLPTTIKNKSPLDLVKFKLVAVKKHILFT